MQIEVKIIIPEGMEIDKENSTFECIKFKPKKLTYDDIARELFCDKEGFCINAKADIIKIRPNTSDFNDDNNATSKDQCEKLLALNKLINVATYLNEGWKADFQGIIDVYYPVVVRNNTIHYCRAKHINCGIPHFKTLELAKKATEILGEETIRTALSQV